MKARYHDSLTAVDSTVIGHLIGLPSQTASALFAEKQTGGQKSIVSCIAMNKTFDGVYAVATYDGSGELLKKIVMKGL